MNITYAPKRYSKSAEVAQFLLHQPNYRADNFDICEDCDINRRQITATLSAATDNGYFIRYEENDVIGYELAPHAIEALQRQLAPMPQVERFQNWLEPFSA